MGRKGKGRGKGRSHGPHRSGPNRPNSAPGWKSPESQTPSAVKLAPPPQALSDIGADHANSAAEPAESFRTRKSRWASVKNTLLAWPVAAAVLFLLSAAASTYWSPSESDAALVKYAKHALPSAPL